MATEYGANVVTPLVALAVPGVVAAGPTGPTPVVPEVPLAVLLPLTAIALTGAVSWRRSRGVLAPR